MKTIDQPITVQRAREIAERLRELVDNYEVVLREQGAVETRVQRLARTFLTVEETIEAVSKSLDDKYLIDIAASLSSEIGCVYSWILDNGIPVETSRPLIKKMVFQMVDMFVRKPSLFHNESLIENCLVKSPEQITSEGPGTGEGPAMTADAAVGHFFGIGKRTIHDRRTRGSVQTSVGERFMLDLPASRPAPIVPGSGTERARLP